MNNENILFRANGHSSFQIATELAGSTDAQEIAEIARQVEGVNSIATPVLRILEGLKSENFIVSEKLETESDARLVVYRRTELSGDDKVADIEWLAGFQHDLWRQGLPIPEMMPFVSEPRTFVLSRDGKLWQRSRFIPGDNYRGTTGELASAARGVAKLDLVLGQYQKLDQFPQKDFGSLVWSDWEKSLLKIVDTSVARLVARHQQMLKSLLASTASDLARLAESGSTFAQVQLIHADLHPKNLICEGEELKAIIDFGNMGYGSLGMDVANAAHRLVRQFVVYQSGSMSQEEALKTGLQIFGTNFADAYQIPVSALRDLPVFMREILLRKIYDALGLYGSGHLSEQICLAELSKFFLMLREVEVLSELLSEDIFKY